MLLSEIIAHLESLYARRATDELDLSWDEWAHVINSWRAKILRQQISDGVQLSEYHEQTICLVLKRLEKADRSYLPTCRGYKSVKFPRLLQTRFGEHVSRVAERPLEPSYKLVSKDNLHYFLNGSRLTKYTPKAVLDNDRLLVYSSGAIEEVYLSGIFENPGAVLDFLGLRDAFRPYDFDYPLSETLLDTLYRGIIDTDFRILKAAVLDVNNDGKAPSSNSILPS